MERSKKEILMEVKEKAPELYNEILSEDEKQDVERACLQGEGRMGAENRRGCCGGGQKKWGGHRHGAGRPKTFCDRKPITKHVAEDAIGKIKEYASANNISENQALEKLINAGYDALK